MTALAHVPRPCDDCPFRREGGIRLMKERYRELADVLSPADGQGATFACHKTTGVCNSNRSNLHCAGALIFAYKQGGPVSQFIRIMERLKMVDPELADGEWPEIFDEVDEMLEVAHDARPKGNNFRCGICGRKGHNARTCPDREATT